MAKSRRDRSVEKVYRFGLYGLSSSGKTCILAALGMNRIPNSQSFTCTWLEEPPWYPLPDGDPSTGEGDSPAMEFRAARQSLKDAQNSLLSGTVPSPTLRTRLLRFAYSFTSPERKAFAVELIDYSGELVDPELTHDRMAMTLREHMTAMDGILILAEAPHLGHELRWASNEMLKLQQAFGTLAHESKDGGDWNKAVAMLVGKWDRRGPCDARAPEDEKNKLLDFLSARPEPPHGTLATAILNTVGATNFEVFPVSAFGESELITTPQGSNVERPKQVNPLASFGLEDPFVWAADRCDEIELQQYETEVAAVSPLQFWQIISSARSFLKGRPLVRRFPATTPPRKRAEKARGRSFFVLALHALCFLALLVVLGLVAETVYDGTRYWRVLAIEGNPEAEGDDLSRAEQWLQDYSQAPFYRHAASRVGFSRTKALKLLEAFRGRREQRAWDQVQAEKVPALQVKLAQGFRDRFPNGAHTEDAKRLIRKHEHDANVAKNRHELECIRKDLELVRPTPVEADLAKANEALDKLESRLNKPPHSDALTKELEAERQTIRRTIHDKRSIIAKNDLEREYWSLIKEGKIVEAAERLVTWPTADEKVTTLKGHFARNAARIVDDKARSLRGEGGREKAYKYVKGVRDAENVMDLLSKDTANAEGLRNLQAEVEKGWDRTLYADVQKYRDQTHVSRYLNGAQPTKNMKDEVRKYEKYLEDRNNPRNRIVRLAKIIWDETWEGARHDIEATLEVNGRSNWMGAEDYFSRDEATDICKTTISAKADDEVTVTIDLKVREKPLFGSVRYVPAGTCRRSVPLTRLSTTEFELPSGDCVNKVRLSLSGLPEEPPLPRWSEK